MSTPEALLDIDQIAAAASLPADAARVLLDIRGQEPAATHRGKPLWLRDALDVLIVGDGAPA